MPATHELIALLEDSARTLRRNMETGDVTDHAVREAVSRGTFALNELGYRQDVRQGLITARERELAAAERLAAANAAGRIAKRSGIASAVAGSFQ